MLSSALFLFYVLKFVDFVSDVLMTSNKVNLIIIRVSDYLIIYRQLVCLVLS